MAGSPYRRRRVVWSILLLALGSLLFLSTRADYALPFSWSLPSYLKDMGLSSSSSPARLVADAKINELVEAGTNAGGRMRVQEIHGLMHFVTAYPDRRLNEADGKINVVGLGEVEVDGSQPVDLRVYAPDGKDEWQQYVTTLRDQRPLILFSKSYCQFSRRAKALFQSLQVSPAPHVVELDLRSDGHIIQSILRRITGRATVPNVLLQGNSIGGSDDIQELHAKGQLRAMLQEGGLTLKG